MSVFNPAAGYASVLRKKEKPGSRTGLVSNFQGQLGICIDDFTRAGRRSCLDGGLHGSRVAVAIAIVARSNRLGLSRTDRRNRCRANR
jgi:hypothetical protein